MTNQYEGGNIVINVLLVEDSKGDKLMVKSCIAGSQDYQLVETLENAANAEIACLKGKVDLILMDICTADDESGLVAAAKIKKHNPNIRIIIMTSMPEYSFIQKAKAIGCDSFWYKEYGEIELLDIMDRTMRGESVYPSETPVVSVGNTVSCDFSKRELEVLRLLTNGNTYDEIAEILHLSINTVKYHVGNLLSKAGYRSAIQLAVDVVSTKFVLPKF
jgi:DNA-binding NarL/FixJ family response regulator